MEKQKKLIFDSPLPMWLAKSPVANMFESFYSNAVTSRNDRFDKKQIPTFQAPYPVISIGGIRAGGTGKTPASILTGEMVQKLGFEAIFLSRGYRKPNKNDVIVRPNETALWENCGDEPALIHYALPNSWLGIGADRVKSVKMISPLVKNDAVFILDDGFQHRYLDRTLDIVCLNEHTLNDRLLPAGYLREPITSLKRAHVSFLIGSKNSVASLENVQRDILKQFNHLDSYILVQENAGWVNYKTCAYSKDLDVKNPIALCGIAQPNRFFDMIKESGIKPEKQISFSDHHRFTLGDFHELYSKCILTTEKDAMRLSPFRDYIKGDIWYLKMRLSFLNDDLQDRFSRRLLSIFK